MVALAKLLSAGDDQLIRAALGRTGPAGAGARFACGFALMKIDNREVIWRGGATDGFTTEILADADGSRAVVLLASKSPPDGLNALARELRAYS
jgi:hypothetical protein